MDAEADQMPEHRKSLRLRRDVEKLDRPFRHLLVRDCDEGAIPEIGRVEGYEAVSLAIGRLLQHRVDFFRVALKRFGNREDLDAFRKPRQPGMPGRVNAIDKDQ